MHYPQRRSKSSLFALAQNYLPGANRQHSQRSQKPFPAYFHQGSRAFDWGETVELSYRDRADTVPTQFPTSSGGRFFDQGDAISLSQPNQSFGNQTIDVTAFSVSDEDDGEAVAFAQVDDDDWGADFDREDSDYTVEGFEYREPAEDGWGASFDNEDSDYTVEGFNHAEPSEDLEEINPALDWDEQAAAMTVDTFDEAIQAAVVTPDATVEPIKSAQSSNGSSVANELALEDQAFAADLQAILSGAKTYDASTSHEGHPSPQTPPSTQKPAPNRPPHGMFDRLSQANSQETEQLDPNATASNNAHSIFDRMGSCLSQATSFDLGTVALEQRFDEIERQLDQQAVPASTVQMAAENSPQTAPSKSLQLDPTELVEDLALIKQLSRDESSSDAAASAPSAQEAEQELPATEAFSKSEVQEDAPSSEEDTQASAEALSESEDGDGQMT